MSYFSNRSFLCHGTEISYSESYEGISIFQNTGCKNNFEFLKLGAKILKFRITSIWITSTLTRIMPIRIILTRITRIQITPTWITPIWFPPIYQIMIRPTFVHYKTYCHGIGILWTQHPVQFLKDKNNTYLRVIGTYIISFIFITFLPSSNLSMNI